MGAQPSTEADGNDGDEEDIFPTIKRGQSQASYVVSRRKGQPNARVGGVVEEYQGFYE